MVVPSRKSRDRRRKKERDSSRDSEEESSTNEEVTDRGMTSHDSGFYTSGINSALGARKKETVEEKKKSTTQRKLVIENLPEEKSLTQDYQNGETSSHDSGLFTCGNNSALGARKKETVEEKKKPTTQGKMVPPLVTYWENIASHGFGARKKETVELVTENVSEENSLTHDCQDGEDIRVASHGFGARKKETVELVADNVSEENSLTHDCQNGDPLSWPSTSGVSQRDRVVNEMRDPSTRPSRSTNGVNTSTPRRTINDITDPLSLPSTSGVSQRDRIVNEMRDPSTRPSRSNNGVNTSTPRRTINDITDPLSWPSTSGVSQRDRIVNEMRDPSTRPSRSTNGVNTSTPRRTINDITDPLSLPSTSGVSQRDRMNGMRDPSMRPPSSTNGINTSTPRRTINDITEMASQNSELEIGWAGLGAQKKEKVEKKEQKKTPLTHNHEQNRDPLSLPSTSGVSHRDRFINWLRDPSTRPSRSNNRVNTSTPRRTINDITDPLSLPSTSGVSQRDRMNGMRDPSTRPSRSTDGVNTSTPRRTINDITDVSVRPGIREVGTPRDRPASGMSSMVTLTDHINTIIKSECLSVMKDVLTNALEKVDSLKSKATKRMRNRMEEYEQISPAETPKKKRALSPASSAEVSILVRTVQRSGSAIGQHPTAPCPGTSGNHHPVDGNMFVQTDQSVHVSRQYRSILPFENCVIIGPANVAEGSRSVTSVTSSQWQQQWVTIDNDHHSVVSGVSSQWRQHRTTKDDNDDNDSDNSGTKSPQSEKKTFFERQDLSNEDEEQPEHEEQPEDAAVEDLSCNLLEFSISGRSSRTTRQGSNSSEMYGMSSVKINLMSTRSYVGSPSDRRPLDHVVSSPSRSQPSPNANQRSLIRQPRLSLPATPPQTVYDAGARNCRCPRCGSVWTSELELEEHYFEHLLGNRSCAVGGCEYTCSSRNELRRHIRAAHLRKHTCRRCGKAYLMASTLERHLRQCLPCRQCPLCPSASVDDAALCDHVASAHGAGQIATRRPELRYYVCRECRFATTSRTVALDHCQRHILGEINLNITLCEICDLLFVTGDLHFLMHAVDDSFNRKSFQVVDFDWRVSLNARRQLESSLKKIQATKAIKASIDEDTSTARSNVEETAIETNDIVAPETETQLKSQEIYNNDSIQENFNNSDLNQNEFDLSPNGENNNAIQDLAQLSTVSKNQSPKTTQQDYVLEPVQSKTLVKIPLEQKTIVVKSNANLDNNNLSLPSSSREDVQNQNAALYEANSAAKTNLQESNVKTQDMMASPNEGNHESQVILNEKKASDDSVGEITTVQENNKQTSLDHSNEFNKSNSSKLEENLDKITDSTDKTFDQCTVSENQLSNTTLKENISEANTIEEPVQSETLVERPLEQQTTVAMNQSHGNMDSNSQSLPPSLAAEAHNQDLDEETFTATNSKESNAKTNDVIALSSEMQHDDEARIDSVEENTSLQQTYVDHTNKLTKPNLPKLEENIDTIKYIVQEIKELMQEANKVKSPVQSEAMVERPLEQQTMVVQSNDHLDNNNLSIPSSSREEVQNQNTALYEATSTAITNFEESNVETQDMMASPNEVNLESQVILNDKEASDDSVEEITTLQENNKHTSLDHSNEFNKSNSSKLEENLDKVTDPTDKTFNHCTVSEKQLSNTTLKENISEANTIEEPLQSETLVERPLEQQTTVAMNQSDGNMDSNSQSLPTSLAAEAHNQDLDEETSTATNSKESNDVIASSSEMQHDDEARIDTYVNHTNKLNKPNLPKLDVKSPVQSEILDELNKFHVTDKLIESNLSRVRESINKMQELTQIYLALRGTFFENQSLNTTQQEDVLEASTMNEQVQSEPLVERPLEQNTAVAMSKSYDNVDNNQSLPSSSTAEVQNQNEALHESNVETQDVIAPPSKIHLEGQVVINVDEACVDSVKVNTSFEENNKQKFLDNPKELHKPNSSKLGENLDKPIDFMDNKLAQCVTDSKNQLSNTTQQEHVLEASTMNEQVQSEPLVERPLEQNTTVAMSKSYDNVDYNQSLPSSSTAEVQNQNEGLHESNVETQDVIATPSKIHLEGQVIISDDEACVDSVKENTSFEENNKQKFLDNTKELNKPNSSKLGKNLDKPIDFMDNKLAQCVTDSKNQLSNTTQQEHVLEASSMNEQVQSEPLVERPLEQQTMVVQSNDHLDNNNLSLPSSSREEVQNQNTALYEATSTAITNFEESNVETQDMIASPNEVNLESQVILNDKKASDDSVGEITTLQENNKHTSLYHSNKFNKSNSSKLEENLDKVTDPTYKTFDQCTVSENQLSNTTPKENISEANTIEEPLLSETLVERPLEQQTTVAMSQSDGNMDSNSQSLPTCLAAEAHNQDLDEETSTATNSKESNDVIASSSEMQHDDEARIDTHVNHTYKLNKPNLPKLEENIDKIKYLVQEIDEFMQEVNKVKGPVQSEILDESNKFHVTDRLIETNLSRLGESINKMQELTQKYLALRGTVFENQSLNTTQQEDVLEASTMNEQVQSEPLVERPLEQNTAVAMSKSYDNVDNNQSLPSSSTAEVQNQNEALHESNVETQDVIAPPSKIHLEGQVIISDDEACVDSVKENTSFEENNKQKFLDNTKELNKPNSSKLGENLDKPIDFMDNKLAQCVTDSKNELSNTTQQEHVLEASTMNEQVQSEPLVERPLEQNTAIAMSKSYDNVDNNQSLPSSSTAEVQNQNEALHESNVETQDVIAPPSKIHLEGQVIINDDEASVDSVKENTSFEENNKQKCLDNTKELNKPNSSKLGENLNKPIDFMDNKLAQCVTDSKNQLLNTTQQEHVLEASSMNEQVQSEPLVERPLEQNTAVAMSKSYDNVDNNQSLPSSSTAEVQNQNAVLGEETSNARSNFEDSNVVTNDIMASPNESQMIANDTNENNDPHVEQYGTDSKTQLSNTTKNQHILEANTMTNPERSEKLVEIPLKQKTTAEISQSNGNVNNNKSLPLSLTVVVQNQNAVLKEDSTHITNFVEPAVKTNQKTVNNDNVKTTTKENELCNDQNLNKASATVNQAYKNKNKTCTIENEENIEKPNRAGEPKSSASKVDGTAIVTENEQKYEVNTNQTKEQKKVLITCSQRKEENNNEASIENNVALSSIDINITISGTKNLSVTAKANSQNVVLDIGTQTSIEEAMSSLNALQETNQIEVLKKAQGSQDLTITEQSIKPPSSTEETHTKKVSTKMSHDQTTNSSSTHDETIIQGDLGKSQTETRDKESMSSGSPKEKTIIIDGVSDKGGDQICIEFTNTLTITKGKPNPDKADQTNADETNSLLATETIKKAQNQIVTPAELTVSSESHTQAIYTNGETSSEDNKTVASTTEETDTKHVLTEKPLFDSNAKKSISSASANNENNTKSTIDDTQDHQASAKLTVISGSQTEATNANDETSGEENKALARTIEETNTKDVTIENAKDRTSNAAKITEEPYTKDVVGKTHGQTNAEKTEIFVVTEEETDTIQVLTEKPHDESNTENTMSSASANIKTIIKATIDETQHHQASAKLTVISGSQTEATNANDETSGEENKALARTIEETNTKDVTIDNAKDRTSNAAKITDEPYTKTVVGKTHVQTNVEKSENFVVTEEETDTNQALAEKPDTEPTTEKTLSSASANNETNIKATIDENQDHQARAKLTVSSGSQTEVTNANNERSGEENKTKASTTGKTDTKDIAIEKAKDLTSNANPETSAKIIKENYLEIIEETYTEKVVIENIHGQINAKETENFVATAEANDTKQVFTVNSHDTTAKETKNSTSTINENAIETKAPDHTRPEETTNPGSPAVESKTKEISEKVQVRTVNEETKSSSCKDKTDSEDVLQKGKESQNQTRIDKTDSLEKTTKETGDKNHLQKTQDQNAEKSKQYEKNETDAKDETCSKTAATTSKKEQQARGRGRGYNNKQRNKKNSRKGN